MNGQKPDSSHDHRTCHNIPNKPLSTGALPEQTSPETERTEPDEASAHQNERDGIRALLGWRSLLQYVPHDAPVCVACGMMPGGPLDPMGREGEAHPLREDGTCSAECGEYLRRRLAKRAQLEAEREIGRRRYALESAWASLARLAGMMMAVALEHPSEPGRRRYEAKAAHYDRIARRAYAHAGGRS